MACGPLIWHDFGVEQQSSTLVWRLGQAALADLGRPFARKRHICLYCTESNDRTLLLVNYDNFVIERFNPCLR